jgi:hypothetical protein
MDENLIAMEKKALDGMHKLIRMLAWQLHIEEYMHGFDNSAST